MTKYLVVDGGLVRDSGHFLGITGSENGLKALEELCAYFVSEGMLSRSQNKGLYEITVAGEAYLDAQLEANNRAHANPVDNVRLETDLY